MSPFPIEKTNTGIDNLSCQFETLKAYQSKIDKLEVENSALRASLELVQSNRDAFAEESARFQFENKKLLAKLNEIARMDRCELPHYNLADALHVAKSALDDHPVAPSDDDDKIGLTAELEGGQDK